MPVRQEVCRFPWQHAGKGRYCELHVLAARRRAMQDDQLDPLSPVRFLEFRHVLRMAPFSGVEGLQANVAACGVAALAHLHLDQKVVQTGRPDGTPRASPEEELDGHRQPRRPVDRHHTNILCSAAHAPAQTTRAIVTRMVPFRCAILCLRMGLI